jgi:hypothetical protein
VLAALLLAVSLAIAGAVVPATDDRRPGEWAEADAAK